MKIPKNLSARKTQQLLESGDWTLDSDLINRLCKLNSSLRRLIAVYQNADGRVLKKVGSFGTLYESRADFVHDVEELESALRQASTEDRIPIEQRQGNYCHETEDSIVLVRAPIEPVAQALNQLWQVKHWKQDVYGCNIDIKKQGFVVFQFRGHSWTCIREYGWGRGFLEGEVQALGKLLNTRIVDYEVSDTGGLIAYDCYDFGFLVEKAQLEPSYPPEFESQLRSFGPEPADKLSDEFKEYVHNLGEFVITEFWEQQNIYIPRLLKHFQAPARVILVNEQMNSNSDETFERDDFERVDYIVRT